MTTKTTAARRTPPPTFRARKVSAKPAPRFKRISRAGKPAIVADALLGLQWGATLPERMTFAEAEAAIGKLNKERFAGKNDWRLPTFDELHSLVDRTKFKPACDSKAFPDTKIDWYYWTSTPVASDPGDVAWVVAFSYGDSDICGRGLRGYVRPVRASQ